MPIRSDEPRARDLGDVIEGAAAASGFSGVVRVTVERTMVLEKAYGLAEHSYAVANTVDTRFGVASGGKLFTALGVGSLIDEGRLSLSARVTDVIALPLPNVSPEVSIGQLLTHTSGVFDYYDEELVDDFDHFELSVPPFKLVTLEDYLPLLTAGAMKFAPGARFSYSNSGFVLLGLAIEAVSGVPYHRFIEERVFRRCGMTATGFFRFDRLPERVATGYIEDSDGWRSNIYSLPIIGGPDGGAFSTTADMERLWLDLFDGNLLSPALTATYLAPAVKWKDDTFYGHGVWLHHDGTRDPRPYIEGCDAGVSFKSTCYTPTTIATVMSNTTEGAWPIAAAIERLMEAGRRSS